MAYANESDRRVLSSLRAFWDADVETYDRAVQHGVSGDEEAAAWGTALHRVAGATPLRIADVGSGTGFLSIPLAAMGHNVTALDLSAKMLERLGKKADSIGIRVTLQEGSAEELVGTYDLVVTRHLLWTLPDPLSAIWRWRTCAPDGRLAVFESLWGAASRRARCQMAAKHLLTHVGLLTPEHHGEYERALAANLPMSAGYRPEDVLRLLGRAGWAPQRLEALRDVEWARKRNAPFLTRLVTPSPYVIVAG